ncbi:MAG: PH domain-containing protein [Corynebacterium sp.]|nr:PH domain-containing protein [Corynebacterium sp.]
MARYPHHYRRALAAPAEQVRAALEPSLSALPAARLKQREDGSIRLSFRAGLIRRVRMEVSCGGTELTINTAGRGRRYRKGIEKLVNSLPEGLIDDQGYRALAAGIGRITSFFIRPELREVPNHLNPGETILAMAPCFFDGNIAIIAITDTRILAVDISLGRGRFREVPLHTVTARDARWGFLTDRMEITARSKTIIVSGMAPGTARRLLEALRQLGAGVEKKD